MQNAGLIKLGEGKSYDLFRNRVMMPIINPFSEVIGFGGRVLDDSLPKYLNSPETAAFNKSRNLYNLNIVRRQKNVQQLVLVEGYMDVIALYAGGIANSVATLGTALTTEQARLAKRYVNAVYISYDGDEAGKKAALRAIGVLEKENLECRVVRIPGGGDPDDFLREKGSGEYLKLLKEARPAMAYRFDAAAEQYDLSDGYQKEKYTKECIEILKTVESAVVKEKYVQELSRRTGFSVHSIMQDIGIRDAAAPAPKFRGQRKAEEQPSFKWEDDMIAVLMAQPDRAPKIERYILPDELEHPANKKIFSYLLQAVKKGFLPKGDEILSVLTDSEETGHIAALLQGVAANGPGIQADSLLASCVKRVRLRNGERERDALIERSKTELDEAEVRAVREQIDAKTKELYRLRQSLKGEE
jgi:DNA primase